MWAAVRRVGQHLGAMAATVLVSLLLAATLVRVAPGFDVDEQQLDPRLSHDSIAAARVSRAQHRNIAAFYLVYLKRALHGDFGRSQILNQPVRELIRQRFPVTLRLLGFGLLTVWAITLAMTLSAAVIRWNGYGLVATMLAGALLCIPTAVLALGFVMLRAPAFLAISAAVFPKMFSMSRNVLTRSYAMQHIVTARAKGISEAQVLLWHVLPVSAAQLIALLGVSVSIGLGAAIPVEALCGIPGIGQLAWQAALGRDLPLLVTLTGMVTLVTLLSNSSADILTLALRPRHS